MEQLSATSECTGEDWHSERFGWVDYSVFAATLLVSVAIGVFHGFFARGKQNTTSEFLMGDQKMHYFSLSISLTVGFASAIAILGNVSEMYNYGTQYVITLLALIVEVPMTVYLLLPVFRELGVTSIYEYLDRRFSNSMRLLISFIFLLQMLMYLSVVVYAPALALRQVTGIDTMYAVAIIFAVGIFYSSMGGLEAVIWTDVFQFTVLMAALVMLVVRGTQADGGPHKIWDLAYDSGRIEFFNFSLDPRVRHTFFSTMIGGSFYWVGLNAAQATLQRLLAVPSQQDALKAMSLSCVGMFVMYLTTFYIGLMTYTHFEKCDPLISKSIDASDQLLPLYMMQVAGSLPGLPGLFVAGIFSASLSTLASSLNAVSACMLHDVLICALGYQPSAKRATLITRLLCVAFGLASFALTFLVAQLGGVLQIAISFNGMIIGVVLAVFMLGMYIPWSNNKGAMAGTLVGLAIVLWLGMGAQVAIINDLFVEPRKEVGVDCQCNVTIPDDPPLDALFDGYRLSYLWYAPLGWLITMSVGMVVSAVLGGHDPASLDPKLLVPVVRKIFVKRYKEATATPEIETSRF